MKQLQHSQCNANRSKKRASAVVIVAALVFAACGSDGDDAATATATDASADPVATTATLDQDESVAATATTDTATTAPVSTEPPVTEPVVDLAAIVQPIIDASLTDESIKWDCCGPDVPPTSVRVGVRVPGYDDVLLASGFRLDGTPAGADDPFDAASIGESLIRQAALALIEHGDVDPASTVDQWAPNLPNADRVTVQMLLDRTTGWTTSYQDLQTSNLLADLERTWTIAEALDLAATLPPDSEPGTRDPTGASNNVTMLALAYILEQVTGESIATVVADQVTDPLGLDSTLLSDGTDEPDNLQAGLFVLTSAGDVVSDPRDLSHVAYRTISPGGNASISTVPDLLDLVDAWGSGDYPGGTAPTTAAFTPERQATTGPGQPEVYVPLDLPFVGICPCEPDGTGVAPLRYGRQPGGVGTLVLMYHYPADGIDIVLHYNSQEQVSTADLVAVADSVHDAVLDATR